MHIIIYLCIYIYIYIYFFLFFFFLGGGVFLKDTLHPFVTVNIVIVVVGMYFAAYALNMYYSSKDED